MMSNSEKIKSGLVGQNPDVKLSLTDPNYPPKGSDKNPIGDKDFTDATNDISANVRVTLGNFLSKKTHDKKNVFPIAVSNAESVNESPNARGTDLSSISSKQDSFVKNSKQQVGLQSSGLGVTNATTPGATNRLVTFFDQSQLDKIVSKTASNPALSGHTLLNTIPYDGIDQNDSSKVPSADGSQGMEILASIHQQLSSGNLNEPAHTAVDMMNASSSDTKDLQKGKLFTVQRNLGSFDKNSKDVISALEMSDRIAEILEDQIVSTYNHTQLLKDPPNANGKSEKSELSSTYPWDLKSGFPAQDNVQRRPGASTNTNSYSPNHRFDNVDGNFDTIKNAIMFMTGEAINIYNTLESLKKNRFVALNQKQKLATLTIMSTASTTGLLTYGKRESRRDVTSINESDAEMRRFADIDFDFQKCFQRGMLLFFGYTKDNWKQTLEQAFADEQVVRIVKESSGYYLSVCRSLVLAGMQADTDSSMKSKLTKFVMTMAALGDVAFKSERGMRDVTPSERLLSKTTAQFIQHTVLSLPMVLASGKPDWKTGLGGALLGTFRKHISRWSPLELHDTSGGANPLSLHTFYAAQRTPPGVGRATTTPRGIRALIPNRENVEMFENAMESEYMPFYVHDLRTHEIISMPAFITGFSENFTANYNAVKGIGRQDAVRIYQDTERAVTFSFMLVSFNEEDFDHMWLTINKFVAMCYPQYSAGRQRETSGSTFIQPFSQVQAASPMIRLRLGDVFKSNYSKFGLARLFGANSSALKNNVTGSAEVTAQVAAQKSADEKVGTSAGSLTISAVKGISSAAEIAYAKTDYGVAAARGLYDEGADPWKVENYISNDQAEDVKTVANFALDSLIEKMPGGQGNAALARTASNKNFPSGSFFDNDKNAIVRSFETSRGRGVAGFITSLALDYSGADYELKMGKKAPKSVKITMGFVPITDLPLGLDYDGDMRNPSHNVGRFAGSYGDVYDDIADVYTTGGTKAVNFNKSTLNRKLMGGQIAADIAVDAAFALDDGVGQKP